MAAAVNSKKLVPASDESALRKKILELHAYDGGTFDSESLLASIEDILNLVEPVVEYNIDEEGLASNEKLHRIIPGPESIHDTLTYLLHKITCVMNCDCSGGDSHASALEILQLLSTYSWEAKIVIILTSFVVEYAQYYLITKLYKSNPLARIVAILKQIPNDADEISLEIKSKFERIISLVKVSIETTRLITKFNCLPSKYISDDAEPMIVASSQLPIAVYWITRVVMACASEFTGIFGHTQIRSSYTETWNITSLEQKITTIQTSFSAQLDVCNVYIEEKKHIKYVEKLKGLFSQKIIHVDNQKILQAILVNKKHGSRPLSCGPDVTIERGVEDLKGKTVLLLISKLDISHEEITKLSEFYEESRTNSKLQYEIVWLPIIEQTEQVEIIEQKFTELRSKMPWYTLVKPSLVKAAVVRYAKEEWKCSKKSVLVALDQRGRVVNHNAFHMVWAWGNQVYPFTRKQEVVIWSRKEWSLRLLVDEREHNISKWMKEEKVICLYGGETHEWIQEFVTTARQIEIDAEIELEMVYVGKNTSTERITKITEIVADRSVCWESTTSTHFWKRIEYMMYSKVHHGAKVTTAKEAGDPILGEVLNILTLGDCDQGWALISQGAGLGAGKIARAKGEVILKALKEFKTWSVEVKEKSFVVALNNYLAGRPIIEHHCNRLILPGIDDIPEIVVCAECHHPMEKYIMYRCCTD